MKVALALALSPLLLLPPATLALPLHPPATLTLPLQTSTHSAAKGYHNAQAKRQVQDSRYQVLNPVYDPTKDERDSAVHIQAGTQLASGDSSTHKKRDAEEKDPIPYLVHYPHKPEIGEKVSHHNTTDSPAHAEKDTNVMPPTAPMPMATSDASGDGPPHRPIAEGQVETRSLNDEVQTSNEAPQPRAYPASSQVSENTPDLVTGIAGRPFGFKGAAIRRSVPPLPNPHTPSKKNFPPRNTILPNLKPQAGSPRQPSLPESPRGRNPFRPAGIAINPSMGHGPVVPGKPWGPIASKGPRTRRTVKSRPNPDCNAKRDATPDASPDPQPMTAFSPIVVRVTPPPPGPERIHGGAGSVISRVGADDGNGHGSAFLSEQKAKKDANGQGSHEYYHR